MTDVAPFQGTIFGDEHSELAREFFRAARRVGSTLTGELLSTDTTWEIPIDGSAPDWLQRMLTDINRVARLGPNWDSYGALPLSWEAAVNGVELLDAVSFRGPAPLVSPTPDGGLSLEWKAQGLGVEVEVSATGDVVVLVDEGGHMLEWTTSVGWDDRFAGALKQISEAFAA